MSVDYRIYCSIYAVGFLASFLNITMAALVTVLCVTGLANYLDWLWS